MELVAVDIGGTHARFAIAAVADGRVAALRDELTLKTAAYAGLETAWAAYGAALGRVLPRAAAIAIASPIAGDAIKLTNNSWILRPAALAGQLGIDRLTLINDFAAVAHAVARLDAGQFTHLCGPDAPFPATGAITVCGPGTGLGVALVVRGGGGYQVIATEGGHIDYAPLDDIEDAIVRRLRRSHRRVSAERIVSGPGIVAIYETLAEIEGKTVPSRDDRTLWTMALDGTDPLATAALDRFCLALGAVAGDLALAHGPGGVVIAGGLGLRLKDRLVQSGFEQRFTAKGRFEQLMRSVPVRIVTHPQPGLFGAAAAFAQEHPE